jgi:hypothetical protein
MDERTGIKLSRYVFGGGALLQILFMTALSRPRTALALFCTGSLLMAVGLFLNFRAKGHNPFKKIWFYPTVLVLLWPIVGTLAAMGVMYGTPREGVPAPGWRTILFSPWTIAISLCLIIGLVVVPQFYGFRAAAAKSHLKWAKHHLARAGDAETQEDFRKEIADAAAQLDSARKTALTDTNTGWFIRATLGDRIIKESELAELKAAIQATKKNGPGKKKE